MPTPFAFTTRSLDADRPLHSWIGWAVALALFTGWLLWFTLARVTVYETSSAARLEVQSAAHPVAAGIAGRAAAVRISLGQRVVAGEVLLALDDRTARLELAEAEALAASLPGRIEALEREIAAQETTRSQSAQADQATLDGARAKLREAEASATIAAEQSRRLEELRGKSLVSEIDWLKARDELQKARTAVVTHGSEIERLQSEALRAAAQEVARLEGLRAQLAERQGQLAQARAAVERLAQVLDQHLIRAPVAGRVGEIASEIRVGAVIQEAQVLARIVPDGELKVVARFLPRDAMGRLHAGQAGRMRLDAFPWTQYGVLEAEVREVGTEIRDGYQQVELAVTHVDPRLNLQHGLTGVAEVAVERVSPANLVLRAAGWMLTRPAGVSDPANVAVAAQ